MKKGVHVPALAVRLGTVAALIGLAALIKAQLPEARRYLKIERM